MNHAVVALLISLAGPDGQIILVNPDAVVSVREPRGTAQGHWPAQTRCLVMTVDGKLIATLTSCADVRRKLETPQ